MTIIITIIHQSKIVLKPAGLRITLSMLMTPTSTKTDQSYDIAIMITALVCKFHSDGNSVIIVIIEDDITDVHLRTCVLYRMFPLKKNYIVNWL